ncbi:MAG: alpha/beta fold hydrolase [Gemmobacter sp.]|uniref:alpha/beta fold hydrolase n=1 Tax=Gemmobacter sp. TaxID=1898957 RepID=UPI00391A96DD
MKTETIAGHPVHLRRMGTGARPVLALHCSLAHGGAWGAMAAHLGNAATLTAPDFPGHGASADLPAGADLHDLSTAIAATLATRIGGGAPVDVLGHSFGGTVAIRLALERPDLVRSLALFEPVLFSVARVAGGPAWEEWLAGQEPFAAMIAQGDRAGAAAWFHGLWGQGPALADLPVTLQRYIIDRIHLIPATNAVLFDDIRGLVVPGRLESLRLPVLLAQGGASPAIVAAVNGTLAARIPGARAISVPGAGHMLPLTHAADLAPALRAHLGLPAEAARQ